MFFKLSLSIIFISTNQATILFFLLFICMYMKESGYLFTKRIYLNKRLDKFSKKKKLYRRSPFVLMDPTTYTECHLTLILLRFSSFGPIQKGDKTENANFSNENSEKEGKTRKKFK